MNRPHEFNKGNIYLSGGMQFAENLGAGWREICSAKLKDMKYFPLDITELDVEYNHRHGKLYVPKSGENPLFYKANIRKHFVTTDLNLIKNDSDALIVFYDESARRGAGTVSEAQYAYNLNLPIFLVCDYPDIHNDVSGWLLSLSTKYFTNFDDLYEYLGNLPDGILKKDKYGNHGVGNKYLCNLCGTVFEKNKATFVSEIKPLYCSDCVNLTHDVHEKHKDRYEFFMEYLTEQTGADFKK